MKIAIRLTLLCLTLAVGTPRAQEVTGNLEGRVLDTQGEAIAGVNITVQGPRLQGVRGTTSDARGSFHIPALPVGSCTVRISHTAYQKLTYERVSVRLGRTLAGGGPAPTADRGTARDSRLRREAVDRSVIDHSGAQPGV